MRDYDMDDWSLEIGFHWPQWEIMPPAEQYNYTTIRLYLFVITLTLDF